MGIRVSEETVRLTELVAESTSQTAAEGFLELRPGKQNIEDVIWLTASPRIVQAKVADGGGAVECRGSIDFDALYATGGGTRSAGASWPSAQEFECTIDVSAAEPGDLAVVDCRLETIDYETSEDGRGIEWNAVIFLSFKVLRQKDQAVITDIRAHSPLKVSVTKDSYSIQETIGEFSAEIGLTETVEVQEDSPKISEVVLVRGLPRIDSVKVLEGSLELSGTLSGTILYMSVPSGGAGTYTEAPPPEADDEPESIPEYEDLRYRDEGSLEPEIFHIDFRTPFEGTVEASGCGPGVKASCDVRLARLNASLAGSNSVELSGELAVEGVIFAIRSFSFPSQVESEGPEEVEVRFETVHFESLLGEVQVELNPVAQLELAEGLPAMEEILDTHISAGPVELRPDEGKVEVDGILSVRVLYIPRGGRTAVPAVATWDSAIPFSTTVSLANMIPEARCSADFGISDLRCRLVNMETAEVGVRLLGVVRGKADVQADIPLEAVTIPAVEPERLSMVFVVVQSGDSLWKLAKRYRTTVEDIVRMNPWLLEDEYVKELEVGWKLCIPGQKAK